jgi:dTMP kinase
MKGKFITIEGGEGSGKTGACKTLQGVFADAMAKCSLLGEGAPNFNFVFTNDPSSATKELSEIRHLLLSKEYDYCHATELLLYAASRAQLVDRFIRPELNRDNVVISDRFFDSTAVYQGILRGHDATKLAILNSVFAGNLVPDLTILLDVDAKIGLMRSIGRLDAESVDEGRWESMGLVVHEKINAGFREIAAKNPDRFVVIRTTSLTEAQVQGEVLKAITEFLSREIRRDIADAITDD